jgi:ribosome-associated protein
MSDRPAATSTDARATAIVMARAAADARCEDVAVIDVRGLSQLTDYIVIASGTSDRQMRTAAEDAVEAAEESGERVFGVSADDGAHWIVVDLVDVVLHLFEPAARAHYDLESLWGDGPRVRWRREEREATEEEQD